jgi:predicted Zn finger-like uncharacterized protein
MPGHPMIVTCPLCRTRYRVAEQELGAPVGRMVRCANCGHSWHQPPPDIDPPPSEAATGPTPQHDSPASDAAPTPRATPRLEVPPRPRSMPTPMPAPPALWRRREQTARGRVVPIVLVLLVGLAVVTGIVARRQVMAIWPSTARLYASIGLSSERSREGLVIGKVTPTRTADALIIDGEIVNLGSAPRDVPRLRVALQDTAEKELQFEIVDPPKARLQPGESVHFAMPFAHPSDAAAGVVVTFAPP